MKIYSFYGINEFIICCGYKGYIIKEYFANYFLHQSDVTFDMSSNEMKIHKKRAEPWKVTLIDTGEQTMTGGRVKRIKDFISKDEDFCLTYGDGLANLDINKLLDFHKKHGKLATVTSVYPPGRFGAVEIKDSKVVSFREKPAGEGGFINGGFFVLKPKALKYIEGDDTIWEKEPLNNLTKDGELMAFKHKEFWQPMDTLREKNYLEKLWNLDKAPWKLWS